MEISALAKKLQLKPGHQLLDVYKRQSLIPSLQSPKIGHSSLSLKATKHLLLLWIWTSSAAFSTQDVYKRQHQVCLAARYR